MIGALILTTLCIIVGLAAWWESEKNVTDYIEDTEDEEYE